MREPDTILRQVDTWRPESLAAYERRRRAGNTTEQDRLMAEAKAMWEAELGREQDAAKGGRPRTTLTGTGVIRFNNVPRGGRPRAAEHGTQGAYKRGCRCDACRAANTAAVRRNRERARAA